MMKFIEPYNPEWKKSFEDIKQVLASALNDLGTPFEIQHIGSTAIPGLIAKPVIDIDIILHDKFLLKDLSARLEKLGYINKGEQGITGRFAFRQSSDFTPLTKNNYKWPSHHLYVCFSDSLALKNHIVFRDALLSDTELVDRYAQLKKSLVEEKGVTRATYTKRKTYFIIAVLSKLGIDNTALNEINKVNI